MRVELPATIVIGDYPQKGRKRQSVPLGFSGWVELPDHWTGGDFEKWWAATKTDETGNTNVWARQWSWAKEKIVEWEIEGLSSNLMQVKDDDLTWLLQSFMASAVIQAMNDYMREGLDDVRAQFVFPTLETLRPSEFMTWHDAILKMGDDEQKSNLYRSWLIGKKIIRSWVNGQPPKDDLDVDLRLWVAIDGLIPEIFLPAMNLGNWSAPRGEA